MPLHLVCGRASICSWGAAAASGACWEPVRWPRPSALGCPLLLAGPDAPAAPPVPRPQALFRRHPSYRRKVREPIRSFFVVRNPYVTG